MRIEGTYTFPAPIEQVFAALTHPDMLSQIIPGCERLAQLGPSDAHHPPIYEIRLRRGPGADVYTLTLTLTDAHAPTSLRADFDGRGPDGPIGGHGIVHLVAHDTQTLATATWEVKSPALAGMAAERQSGWNDSAEQFARSLRDRATSAIFAVGAGPASVRHLTTPRGRVVILPRGNAALSLEQRMALRRAVWLGGGLLAGLAAIGFIVGIVRRLTPSRAEDSSMLSDQ
jgi:carbon monoxide dehydrogenase subunit G